MPGMMCAYTPSVIVGLEWPSRSDTTLTGVPALGSRTVLTRQLVADRLSVEAVSIDAQADQLGASADGYERAVRELAELEREKSPKLDGYLREQAWALWQPEHDRQVQRRRAGVESLRSSLAATVAQILEEGD